MKRRTCILLGLITALCIQTSVKGNSTQPTKEDVLQFFAQFEDAYSKKDKSELTKILDTSQQEWCFDELDRGANPVKFEVDKGSIEINPPRATVSTLAYRQMKGGGSSSKTQLVCLLEERDGVLILVNMKAPEVEAANTQWEIASELAQRLIKAIKNNDQKELVNLLKEKDPKTLQDNHLWIKKLLSKGNGHIQSNLIEKNRNSIYLTFLVKDSSGQISKHVMYLDKYDNGDELQYYLTKAKPK